VGAVTPEVFDEDVGCVGLGGEAVVADVDAGVCYGQAIDVEGVEAVGVFGEGLFVLATNMRLLCMIGLLMHWSTQRQYTHCRKLHS
jgi:hypothetical protein